MVNKYQLKIINFILCLDIIAFAMPIKALAMDSPTGKSIEEFPVPGNSDTVIVDNYGTINFAKSGGDIAYNFYRINNLEGAIVGENKSEGTIDIFISGRVENNYGTINKVNNTASIGTNAPGGVIKENSNDVDKNMGTIENQYSGTIKENYGDVGTVGASATIAKLYEGTITENKGNVVVCPEPNGIETTVTICTNYKSVKIEADPNNKSTVVIDNNEADASLYVCDGADCTVTNNAGKIEIAKGGTCNIATNTGTVIDQNTPSSEYNYELILDNVDPADITFVDFYRAEDNKIYVMDEGPDHNVIVEYDTDKYFYPGTIEVDGSIGIRIEDSDYSKLDREHNTFTIHFHKMGEFVPSSDGKHMQKCGGYWNGSECRVTFNEEACSYSWVCENGKHKQVCAECSATKNVGNCSYGEWIIDSEAKVGVAGKKHRVCSVCKGVENATIPTKSDNAGGKADSEQGGSEQNINPTKEAIEQVTNPIKSDTAKVIKSTGKNTAQSVNPQPGSGDIPKADSPNTNPDEKIDNNSDGKNEEVETTDSVDIDSDSVTAIDDLESSEQESETTEGFESNETVSPSNKLKIGIIAGVSAFATVATASFFIHSRKKVGKKRNRRKD